jgi:hypothetical protein
MSPSQNKVIIIIIIIIIIITHVWDYTSQRLRKRPNEPVTVQQLTASVCVELNKISHKILIR